MANTILLNEFKRSFDAAFRELSSLWSIQIVMRGIVMNKLFYIISFLGLVMLLDLTKNPLGPNDPMLELTLSTPVYSAQGRIDTSDQLVINYTETPDSSLTNKTVLSPITDANTASAPPKSSYF